jgi:subtilisin
MSIKSDLDAFGMAQVLVILKPNLESAAGLAVGSSSLEQYFSASEDSRDGALAAMAATGAGVRRGVRRQAATAHQDKMTVYPNLGIALGNVNANGLAGLKAHARVDQVLSTPEFSLIRPVAQAESTALATGPTWGIKKLNVPKLWAAGIDGKGVIVGHLDTGIDGKHPALKTAIHAFAEFDMQGTQIPNAPPRDSGEHGTHTAGTIAGRPVSAGQFGVAPGCKLASALVIEGGNIIKRILGGMDWIVGQKAKILSMSLGLRGFSPEFLPLMQILRNRGVLPVIAVGNEGPGSSRSPGNYPICLSVGAADRTDRVADFSSSQRFNRPNDPLVPDIVAPGVSVFSALPGKRFGEMDGSSMATPHIAGLAALLWQAKPDATVDQIEAAIYGSCTRPATMPLSRANRGLPDAVKALKALTGTSLGAVTKAASPAKKKARPKAKTKSKA